MMSHQQKLFPLCWIPRNPRKPRICTNLKRPPSGRGLIIIVHTNHFTRGGQKLRTGSLVLPVAEKIFRWMYFASFLLDSVKMFSATGRTRLSVRSFCTPLWFPVYEVAMDLWSNFNAMDYPCCSLSDTAIKYRHKTTRIFLSFHSEEAKLSHAKCFILHNIFMMWLSHRFAVWILQAYVFTN